MNEVISNIIYTKTKVSISCPGKTIEDAINFGFSYIEHEDHIVQYIVANKKLMKRIFADINDSVLDPDKMAVGGLWTAKLLLSNKLLDSQIIFSNSEYSVVIDIDINPNTERFDYA